MRVCSQHRLVTLSCVRNVSSSSDDSSDGSTAHSCVSTQDTQLLVLAAQEGVMGCC